MSEYERPRLAIMALFIPNILHDQQQTFQRAHNTLVCGKTLFSGPMLKTLSIGLLAAALFAHAATRELYHNSEPAPRTQEYSWMSIFNWHQLHQKHLQQAKTQNIQVLFLGDSITAGWPAASWRHYFADFSAANFAIGGDHTGNIRWRLQQMRNTPLQPKVVVVLAGVNNFLHFNQPPQQVFTQITLLIKDLQHQFPQTKILLQGILPYGQNGNTTQRRQVIEVNQLLRTLADSERIIFRDYGNLFLQPDGSISPVTMADFIHPTAQAYDPWGKALATEIKALLPSP